VRMKTNQEIHTLDRDGVAPSRSDCFATCSFEGTNAWLNYE
jgi:hypothetical protein